MPACSSASFTRRRNSRSTPHCFAGSVFITTRMVTPSGPQVLDTPHLGFFGDLVVPPLGVFPHLAGDGLDDLLRMTQVGFVGDLDVEEGACPTAADLLATRWISPLGTCHITP